jgi:hypothetical protein
LEAKFSPLTPHPLSLTLRVRPEDRVRSTS